MRKDSVALTEIADMNGVTVDRPITLDLALAAEIAEFALEVVGRQVPNFAPADVIAHLCGATAAMLLGSLQPAEAIRSIDGWKGTMVRIIAELAEVETCRHSKKN